MTGPNGAAARFWATVVNLFWSIVAWLSSFFVDRRAYRKQKAVVGSEEEEELLTERDEAPLDVPQTVIVLRHAERQDEIDPTWAASADAPWDPPLSSLGERQAEAVGKQLQAEDRGLSCGAIVCSPLHRCLQTAAAVAQQLGMQPAQVHVRGQLCELLSARNLNLNGAGGKLRSKPADTASWFWNGHEDQEAVREVLAAAWGREAAEKVNVGPLALPSYPETQQQGRERYREAVEQLAAEFSDRSHLLLVTHGEAVSVAVSLAHESAVVFEVQHCGYAQLQRRDGFWQLQQEPEDHGVSFLVE